MSGEGLTVSILRDMDQVTAVREEWDELFEASSADPCASYDWFVSLVSCLHLEKDVCVCVVRDSKGAVGIIPLHFRRRRALGVLPTSVVTVAGGGWPMECPILLADRARGMPVVQAALQELHSEKPWVCCTMTRVPRTSAIVSNIDGNGTLMPHMKFECQAMSGSIIVELPDSMDEYKRTLSGHFRREINRQVRGLTQEGEVKLVRLGFSASEPGDRIMRLIEDSISVSQRSWQGEAERGRAISDPDIRDFFSNAVIALARKGMTDLSVLYLGSKPISFDWGVARGTRVSSLKGGFDSDFRQFGPGTVHEALLIEDSIERGMTEIDLGGDFLEYKRKWGRKEREMYNVQYYPGGVMSAVVRRWRRHHEQKSKPKGH